jgi:hypothetical protein
MRIERLEAPVERHGQVDGTGKTLTDQVLEVVHHKMDWFRARVFGACPECHSIHIEEVYGWDKLQCKECHCTWRQGF